MLQREYGTEGEVQGGMWGWADVCVLGAEEEEAGLGKGGERLKEEACAAEGRKGRGAHLQGKGEEVSGRRFKGRPRSRSA